MTDAEIEAIREKCIAAERERCAQVCEAMAAEGSGFCNSGLMRTAWIQAAAEIRNQTGATQNEQD